MIRLPNGRSFEFCAAAGALGYDGLGYPWEWPFRWAGLLDPRAFTVVTKTLTLKPRRGNLRWYAPWRAVRPLGGGNTVNAVGLTNPGLPWWPGGGAGGPKMTAFRHNIAIVLSVRLEGDAEAWEALPSINQSYLAPSPVVAVELNASCPNVRHDPVFFRDTRAVALVLKGHCPAPVIIKVPHEGAAETCRALEGLADAFDLGQSVPWADLRPDEPSPLYRPLRGRAWHGALSGPAIRDTARRTLEAVRPATRTPLISGGGIDSADEVRRRFDAGADAVAFGTLFLYRPWAPNRVARELRGPPPGPPA